MVKWVLLIGGLIVLFVILNLLVDIVYSLLDPRVRIQDAKP